MPDPRDFLPMLPWEGPPVPRFLTPVTPEVTKPQYLYHASRRGDLYKKGIEPSTAGVIKKDPEGVKVFMASDPEGAVGAILSEERLKTEQGVPGYPYKGKGEIVVYRVKLPEGDYYQDPRSGDYITKRAIKPEEIVDWKLRGQKFPEPIPAKPLPVTPKVTGEIIITRDKIYPRPARPGFAWVWSYTVKSPGEFDASGTASEVRAIAKRRSLKTGLPIIDKTK